MAAGDANAKLEGAFLQLIEEKHFSKITVNDIVEKAGVHRNTFYYHYQSIPAMLGVICQRMVEKMFIIYRDVQSPSDCILPLVRYSIERYIDNVTEKTGISRRDREIMTRFYKAGLVGVWTEWVEEGLENDSSEDFIRIGNILGKMTMGAFAENGNL